MRALRAWSPWLYRLACDGRCVVVAVAASLGVDSSLTSCVAAVHSRLRSTSAAVLPASW